MCAGLLLHPADVRHAVREGREGNLVLFAVDASGSMAAKARMAAVTGAVLSLLRDAYQRRDKVGLITFRGTAAELVLPPTSSVPAARVRLAELRTGGRTPLAGGLLRARKVLAVERLRDPRRRALLVVLTDGRATVGVNGHTGGEPVRDACRAAALLAADGVATVVVDCESGPVRLGLAARIARAAAGELVGIGELSADRVTDVVRAARAAVGGRRCRRDRSRACPSTGSPPASAATARCSSSTPGEMKGKSTAAFGLALRGWNQGWSIGVFQFVKSAKWKVGEEAAFRALGRLHAETGEGGPVEWHKMGEGWSWARKAGTEADHAAQAAEGWAEIRRRIEAQTHQMYVLDEFTYPMKWGWVDVGEVVDVLARREGRQHVIVTGRDAAPELVAAADLVMETTKIKHPMDAGQKGQRGIEW